MNKNNSHTFVTLLKILTTHSLYFSSYVPTVFSLRNRSQVDRFPLNLRTIYSKCIEIKISCCFDNFLVIKQAIKLNLFMYIIKPVTNSASVLMILLKNMSTFSEFLREKENIQHNSSHISLACKLQLEYLLLKKYYSLNNF